MAAEADSSREYSDDVSIDIRKEIEDLYRCIARGDKRASVHLARLIESDSKGALQPFAEALWARLCDHLNRYAEMGDFNAYTALEDEVYNLIKSAAHDWDGIRRTGRPGEEA